MKTALRHFDFLPAAVARLPRDERGYPIPYFVSYPDGKPEFKLADQEKFSKCIKENRCWICGGPLGSRKWFVLGPMCTVTRTTSEPPCHRECAEFACRVCPFLTKPLAKRGDTEGVRPGGAMIERNPGVAAIWETKSYTLFEANGVLFEVGPPLDVTYWREGRRATYEEVLESVETGVPALADLAATEGEEAINELFRTLSEFRVGILDRFVRRAA